MLLCTVVGPCVVEGNPALYPSDALKDREALGSWSWRLCGQPRKNGFSRMLLKMCTAAAAG